ncbi:MAG: FecR domain-containing protein [Bacteroidetes bacterium]|nr:FecR domain-containing protein [Bacteroidota bacterium]
MNKAHTYYETLITRYFSGEAGADEVMELSAWVRSDPAHQQLFKEYQKSWALVEASNMDASADLDTSWAKIAQKTGINEAPAPQIIRNAGYRRFARVAAILLILIIPALFYFWNYMRPGSDVLYAENQIVESTLSDGTMVALNTGSTLEYPERFKGKERTVTLEGEAFFDVSHVYDKAFVINADKLKIRVLGTTFNVNTNAGNNTIEVVLVSGEIQLVYNEKQMLLHSGEKAVVLKQFGEIVKKENDDLNFMAWKTKRLEFTDTPFSEIIDVLRKVYHKDISVLNPEILDCRITATFEQQSLETVLKVLQSTIDIEVKSNASGIEISGNGCQ